MSDATLARERYPLWLRAVDRAAALRRGPELSEAALLRVARRRSGLHELDLGPVRTPLQALLADFAEHPLSALGRVAVFEALTHALENRLRWTAFLAAHPEVRARPLPRPLVVVGLHRSGTTFLHGLLAQGPGRRAPAFWELLRPVPGPGRRAAARRALWLSRRVAPELQAIHPVRLDGPEECWTLLANSLRVVSYALHFALPRYARWLDEADARPAYAELALQLRVIEHARPEQPLVLKCPEHLWQLEALLEAFPDAGVVWTHRDPQRCVPSYASLSAVNLRTLAGRVERRAVGPRITAGLAAGLERALAA
ncbi:MAG: sulfotransferase, partial [Planctomycetes bacterium]|nr:sulfotransferase [Planctomycetota bacterium]